MLRRIRQKNLALAVLAGLGFTVGFQMAPSTATAAASGQLPLLTSGNCVDPGTDYQSTGWEAKVTDNFSPTIDNSGQRTEMRVADSANVACERISSIYVRDFATGALYEFAYIIGYSHCVGGQFQTNGGPTYATAKLMMYTKNAQTGATYCHVFSVSPTEGVASTFQLSYNSDADCTCWQIFLNGEKVVNGTTRIGITKGFLTQSAERGVSTESSFAQFSMNKEYRTGSGWTLWDNAQPAPNSVFSQTNLDYHYTNTSSSSGKVDH